MMDFDQSGKVEEIGRNTILCVSNSKWNAIVIKSSDKKILKKYFNKLNMPKNYVLFVFCAGIAILFDNLNTKDIVVIDEEYTGKNHIIKNLLMEMMGKKLPEIRFGRIGKKSMAHCRAYGVATGKIKRNANVKVVKLTDVLGQIKKTKAFLKLSNA